MTIGQKFSGKLLNSFRHVHIEKKILWLPTQETRLGKKKKKFYPLIKVLGLKKQKGLGLPNLTDY